MKTYIPKLYSAIRGSDVHYGNEHEIGTVVGLTPKMVIRAATRSNHVTRSGWTVTRVPRDNAPVGYRNAAAQHYIATKDGEDPIMGDADEVSALIGTAQSNVRSAIREGRAAKGWMIRAATDEEVAEFESRWA